MKHNTIDIPWGAWYGDRKLRLKFPESWLVTNFTLQSDRKISDSQISEKLNALDLLLQKKNPKSIIIAVDDLTRPVLLEELMEQLLTRITQFGVSAKRIKIIIGLGSHQGLNKEALLKKLGRFATEKFKCINHHPQDTVPIDIIWGKTPVKLNKHYLQADFKIVISGLTPHSFAGFSGGAKMLFPGLADMETIAKTHKSVLMGFMGKLGDMAQNKFRDTIEEFVNKAGLDFFIGVVINADRSIRNIHCGDYISAHRLAAEEARNYYLLDLSTMEKPFDAVILNAYPKDTELLQAENGFIPIKSAKRNLVREEGIVVLTSACSEGMGHHGLFAPDGVLYRKPRLLRFLKERPLYFHSAKITVTEFHALYHESYHFVNDMQTLIKILQQKLPENARVAVFPYASLQLTG